MLKKIGKNISKGSRYYFFSNLFEKITSVLFFIIIAKLFNTDEYGQIVTIFAVSNITLIFFNFGLPIYLQRETALKKDSKNILMTILFIKFLLILPYFIFIFLYFEFILNDVKVFYIIIISIAALILDFVNTVNHFFFGKERFDFTFFAVMISRFALIVLGLIFWYSNKTIIYFISIYLITALIQLLFLSLKLKKIEVSFSFPRKFIFESKKLLNISLPLGIAMLLNFLYDKIDILLIANYIGENGVAQYNVAYSFYKLSGLLFGMILVPSFNIFSKQAKDLPVINDSFIKIGSIITLISLVLLLVFYFFGGIFIDIIFGSKYDEAEKILPILSFAIVGFGLNNFTGVYLNSKAQFKIVMYSAIAGIIVNLIINIIYLPKIGIIAAVYSSICTEYVLLFFQSYFIFKIYRNSK